MMMTRDEISAIAKQLDIQLFDYQLDFVETALSQRHSIHWTPRTQGRRDVWRLVTHILSQGDTNGQDNHQRIGDG